MNLRKNMPSSQLRLSNVEKPFGMVQNRIKETLSHLFSRRTPLNVSQCEEDDVQITNVYVSYQEQIWKSYK